VPRHFCGIAGRIQIVSNRVANSCASRFLRLGPQDDFWPPLWEHLTDPPLQVTVAGCAELLARRSLGIVGTRRASARGLAVASALAGELARSGWVIVSGLARGIDAAAHQGALAAGGLTIAVMATGCDRTYPGGHLRLRQTIEASGCVVTEQPDGAGPRKHHFPRRNRLIAGLVEGLIVVEAPRRSGALITAYLALDLGREVMAVPGPVDRRESLGCHQLIKEGAALVDAVDDIHHILAPPATVTAPQTGKAAGEAETRAESLAGAARWIWNRLDLEGVSRDELRSRWPGSGEQYAEGMVRLEMQGLVRRLPGRKLARRIFRFDRRDS
jgi:DNA processing protein